MASLTRCPDGHWRARYRSPDDRKRARHFDRRADAKRWLAPLKANIVRCTYLDPAPACTTFQLFGDRWRSQHPRRLRRGRR